MRELPGIAIGARIPTSAAQNAAEMGHPGKPSLRLLYDVRAFGAAGDGKTHRQRLRSIGRLTRRRRRAEGRFIFGPGNYLVLFDSSEEQGRALSRCRERRLWRRIRLPMRRTSYDLAESNQPWEDVSGLRAQSLAQQSDLGRRAGGRFDLRAGTDLGQRVEPGMGRRGRLRRHPGVANKAIALKNCRNVILRDFSILHGGHFGILATGVDNLTIDNLKIDTNRDGMDIDCCRNVRITNCSVNSPWDDGICLKSSFALGYARATEMVTISNCMVSGQL